MNSLPDMGLLSDQIRKYLSVFPKEKTRLKRLLDMATDARLLDRSSFSGHVTASGIVVDEDKMLMIFHPYLRKWLQPGGHVELRESPLEAAAREVLEETGVSVVTAPWHQRHLMPIDIDVHLIPENPKKKNRNISTSISATYLHLSKTHTKTLTNFRRGGLISAQLTRLVSRSPSRNYITSTSSLVAGASSMDEFFHRVIEHNTSTVIEKLVIVTHLVPGSEEFLLPVNDKLRIAAVIPKPTSIDHRIASHSAPRSQSSNTGAIKSSHDRAISSTRFAA